MRNNKQQSLAIILQQELLKTSKKGVYRDKNLVLCYEETNEILSQQQNNLFWNSLELYAYVETHYCFRVLETELQCKIYFCRNDVQYNFNGHQIINYFPMLEEYFKHQNIILKSYAQNEWKNIYVNFQTKFSISSQMLVKHRVFINQITHMMQKLHVAIMQLFAVFESQIKSKKQFVSSISDIIELLDITDDKYDLTQIQQKISLQEQPQFQQQKVTTTYSIIKFNKQANIDNNKTREFVKKFKGNNLVQEKLVLQQNISVQISVYHNIFQQEIIKGHTLIMVRTPNRQQIQQCMPNLTQNQLQTINKYFKEKIAKNYDSIKQFRNYKYKVNHYIFQNSQQRGLENNIFFLDYHKDYFKIQGPPSQENLCKKLQLLKRYITLIQHNAQDKIIHSNLKPSNLLINETFKGQNLLMSNFQNARKSFQLQFNHQYPTITINSKINQDLVAKQFIKIMKTSCGNYQKDLIQKYQLQTDFSAQNFNKYVKIVLKMLTRTIHSTQPNLRPPLVKSMLKKLQSYMKYRQQSHITDPQIKISQNQMRQFISKFYDFYGFISITQSIGQQFMPPLYSRKLLDNFGQIAVMKLLGLGEHIEKQIKEQKIQNIKRIQIILKILKQIARKLNKQELTQYLNAVN